jgi:hypothetical protein
VKPREPRPCGDCKAAPGDLHTPGCDVERCVLCGGQAISCHCVYQLSGIDTSDMEEKHPEIFTGGPSDEMYAKLEAEEARFGGRLPWTGIWPGVDVCHEIGIFCAREPIDGVWHVPCGKEYVCATEDLNRIPQVARWHKESRRWVPLRYRLTETQLKTMPVGKVIQVEVLDDLQFINDEGLPDGFRVTVCAIGKRAVMSTQPKWTDAGLKLPDVDYIYRFPTLSGRNRWLVT